MLRQLVLHGRDGLPVLSEDGSRVEGWVTNAGAIHAITAADPEDPPNPLTGYRVIEILLEGHCPAAGKPLGTIGRPEGRTPVSVVHGRVLQDADPCLVLAAGDRVNVLVRATGSAQAPSPGEG